MRASGRRLAALALGLLVTLPVAQAEAARLLLAAGHDRGDADQPRLRFSESEAAEFAAVMKSLGGVPPQGVQLLQGRPPAELRTAFTTLASQVAEHHARGERVEVFVFLSGHARNGALSLGGEPVALGEIRTRLDDLGADVVVAFTDACSAGRLLRAKGMTPTAGYELEVIEAPDDRLRGQVLITSSGAAEPAFESDRLGGSLFARNLLAGLRGAADADHDGRVALTELYGFLHARVVADALAEAGRPQVPQAKLDLVGAGPLVVTEPARGSAAIRFGAEHAGAEVWVVDADAGRSTVELRVPSGGTRVALYPGRFQVFVRSPRGDRLVDLRLVSGADEEIASDDGRLALQTPLRTRGGGMAPRFEIAAGYRFGSPLTRDGARSHGGWVALEIQTGPWVRVALGGLAGAGPFSAGGVEVEEFHAGGEAGVWLSPVGRVQGLAGGRVGVLGVHQQTREGDPGWHSIGAHQLPAVDGLAVTAMVDGGLLVRLGGRGTFRASVAAGVALAAGAKGPGVSPRLALTLGFGALP